jgi:insulysin
LDETTSSESLTDTTITTTTTTNTQTEEWYGTQYERIPIDDALWNQWRQANHSDYPDLTLPQVNDMIATEFELVSESTDATTSPKEEPICILKTDPILRLWYKPDNVFQMPKVNLLFHFASGDVLASPEAVVMTQLFAELVTDACNEYTYLASMAGLHCEIGLSPTGLELHVTGYHHKADVLVERIVDTCLSITSTTETNTVDAEVFGRIVSKMEQQYQSFLVGAQPYQHAIYGADLCLEDIQFTVSEKLAVLKRVTSTEVLQFATRFWKHCQLEGLVHGNVTAHDATTVLEMIWNKLGRSRDERNTHSSVDRRVVQLQPATSYLYRFAEFNDANTNSVLQIVLQMGETATMALKDNATLAFLHHLIKEPAFNQLRTEEQLGYIVHTSIKTSGDTVKGLLFLVQSDSHDPIHVEGRVEAFLATVRQRIIDMTPEDFQQNVEAVVASFLEKVRTTMTMTRGLLLGISVVSQLSSLTHILVLYYSIHSIEQKSGRRVVSLLACHFEPNLQIS